MATLDEIAKEKQRISEALARADAQREKLVSQLSELEATERVLARYSKGPQAKRAGSGKTPAAAMKTPAPAQSGRRRRAAVANQLAEIAVRQASAIRSLPWQRARRSGKSPPHARGFARSASPLPGTNGLAGSRSVMGSSTPRTRRERNSTPRPNSTEKCRSNGCKRPLTAEKGPGVRISFSPALSHTRAGPAGRQTRQ
jgi:hypothetical protein